MKNLLLMLIAFALFCGYENAGAIPRTESPPIIEIRSKGSKEKKFRAAYSADEAFIGDYVDFYIGWRNPYGSGGPNYQLSSLNFSGTSYTVISDSCSGANMPAIGSSSSQCSLQLRFQSSVAGSFKAIITGTFTAQYPDPLQNVTAPLVPVTVSFRCLPNVLAEDGNPLPPNCPLERSGSIVRIDAQSLGEIVPIVGTNYFMNYSSEMSQGYVSSVNTLNRNSSFNPEGWTLNVQHHYDLQKGYLYLGTGTSFFRRNLSVDQYGNYLVLSLDGKEVYEFDEAGKHLNTKSSLTGSTKYTFAYNSTTQNLISVTDAYGRQTSFNRSSGVLYQITAPFGQQTAITIGANGLIESITNPNSETYSFTYKTGTDLLETFTKPGGQVSTFSYGSTGRLTKDLGHAGNFWELLEDLQVDQRVVTKTSNMSRAETFYSWGTDGDTYTYWTEPSGQEYENKESYDGWHGYKWNPQEYYYYEQELDPRFGKSSMYKSYESLAIDGQMSQTGYSRQILPSVLSNIFGFTTITDTKTTGGHTTTAVYTAANKTTVITSPEGATRSKTIDGQEKVVSEKIGNDSPTTYSYNVDGQLHRVTEGSSHLKTNTYNSAGFLYKSTDVFNNETTYTYDLAGRVNQITYPNGKFVTYTYDSNGNVTGVTPPSRPEHVFEFNAMELLSEYQPPALSGLTTKDTLYTYNLDKQLTNILRPDGQSITNIYDSTTGLLNQVQLARGNNTIQYVPNSDLVEEISSADGILSTYSLYGRRFKGEQQKRASDGYLYAGFSYSFDTEHKIISRSLTGHSTVSPSIIDTIYNDDDMPIQIGDLHFTYSYPSGRLSTTTLDLISDARTYDTYGYLESYTATYNPTVGSPSVIYSYTLVRDVLHRITQKTETVSGVTNVYEYTYDNLGRLETVVKDGNPYSDYVYDDNGNRTSGTHAGVAFTATYDNQDRLLTYNSRTYSYNANGDNTFVQWNVSQSSSFGYDAFGNLISSVDTSGNNLAFAYDGKNRLVSGSVNGTTTFRRIYENDVRIGAELDANGGLVKEFVYSTSINAPDYMIEGGSKYRLVRDHLGSVRLVVKASDGTVAQRIDYSELGKVLNNSNPNFQPYGFAGGIIDESSQRIKFGARFYDPEVGRWVSKDPIRFDGGSVSLYEYVNNDPINRKDPSGLAANDDETTDNAGKTVIDGIKETVNGKNAIERVKAVGEACMSIMNDALDTLSKQVNQVGKDSGKTSETSD